MPSLLLLGGNRLNRGVYEKFRASGHAVYVVDWNDQPDITGDRHFRIDVKDPEAILAALSCAGLDDITLVYTSIDLAAPVALKLNNQIHGYGDTEIGDTARFIAKGEMTRRWREAGLLNRFARTYAEASKDIAAEVASLHRIIVKPNISSSSRAITIVQRSEDGWAKRLDEATKKAAAESADGKIIVEEFVTGTELTAEMIADRRGDVTIYAVSKKAHSPYLSGNKVATKLLYNFDDVATQRRVADFALQAFRALEPCACLGHMELILANEGHISPLECAFRSSGFIASPLVDIASGRDYLGDYQAILAGGPLPDTLLARSPNASMFYFYDAPPGGVLNRPMNLLDYLPDSVASLFSDRKRLFAGAVLGTVGNDNERLGYEILVGPRDVLTMDLILEAERAMVAEAVQ